MTLQHVDILFQLIVFLFAISVHESAHAWMANRCGDPTARMLGRISLNPIRHIDPVGTVLLPLIALVTHFPMLGWAKPTPVDPRNFKNLVWDDILTTLARTGEQFHCRDKRRHLASGHRLGRARRTAGGRKRP